LHPKLLDIENKLNKENFIDLSKPEIFFNTSKMKELLNLLNEIKTKEEKVLIFVIRHSMQTLLQTTLQNYYGFEIDIINGKNNKQELVDRKLEKFENKKGFNILLMSPLAAGIGLTITAANHVIHLERHWNPAKEDQASDRIYRIGQEKDVYIYHLIHTAPNIETFDSGLNKLIENKKSLSEGTLIPTPSIKDSEMVESFFHNLSESEKWDLMSPEEFEIEVMHLYEKLGYKCHTTAKIPTEYGADIIAVKDNKIVAIQCKHTRIKKKQGRDAIRQLIAETKLVYPEAKLVAVTNFYFNENARKLAKRYDVKLIEREDLMKMNSLIMKAKK
jgi:Holliday junction resolvase